MKWLYQSLWEWFVEWMSFDCLDQKSEDMMEVRRDDDDDNVKVQ